MKLVCPSCGAQHQVSRVQRTYRGLPCRKCGARIPLSKDTLLDTGEVSTGPLRPVAARAQSIAAPPRAATAPAAVATAPAPTARPIQHLAPDRPSGEQLSCAACGTRYNSPLSSCPTCFHTRAAVKALTARCPKCGAGVPGDSIACPECLHLLHDKVTTRSGAPVVVIVGMAVAVIIVGLVVVALWWRSVR